MLIFMTPDRRAILLNPDGTVREPVRMFDILPAVRERLEELLGELNEARGSQAKKP